MSASVYLVMSGLLWGTGGLTGAEFGHVTGLSALAVAAYRLLAGGGLIVILGCYFTAVSLTSVSLATLITIGGSPVIVQVAERFRGRGRGAAGATVLALCGLGLLAAAGFATLTLIGASPVPGLDDLTVTGFGFAFGGLVLLPFAAISGLAFRPGPAAIGLLIALGTGPTAAAYTLYFRGLRGAPPGTAALLALLEPLTATLLAALLLGERLSLPGLAGAALLLAAVVRTALRGSPVTATAGPRRRSWRRTSRCPAGSSPRPPQSAARR